MTSDAFSLAAREMSRKVGRRAWNEAIEAAHRLLCDLGHSPTSYDIQRVAALRRDTDKPEAAPIAQHQSAEVATSEDEGVSPSGSPPALQIPGPDPFAYKPSWVRNIPEHVMKEEVAKVDAEEDALVLERCLATLDLYTNGADAYCMVSQEAARLLRELHADFDRIAGAYVAVEPEKLCRDAANRVRAKWRLL